MNEIHIIPFSDELLGPCVHVYIDAFAGEPWNEHWEFSWATERISWVSGVEGFIGYVALLEGKVVGSLLGYKKPYKGTYDFELLELFIEPNSQNKGIGKRLVNELAETAKDSNIRAFHLTTARGSISEHFYKSINFESKSELSFLIKRL